MSAVGRWVRRLLRRPSREDREHSIVKRCGCICWCPECDDPLNDQAKCLDGERFVEYWCGKCGHHSVWDFGAPTPLLIRREPIRSDEP
jgi:hypothetical protein